jgi:hypothetical protein
LNCFCNHIFQQLRVRNLQDASHVLFGREWKKSLHAEGMFYQIRLLDHRRVVIIPLWNNRTNAHLLWSILTLISAEGNSRWKSHRKLSSSKIFPRRHIQPTTSSLQETFRYLPSSDSTKAHVNVTVFLFSWKR